MIPMLTNIFQRGWNHQLVWFVVFLVGRATLWWCKWSRLVGELNTLAWNQVLPGMRKPQKMKGKQPPRVVWLMVFALEIHIHCEFYIICVFDNSVFFVQLQNLTGSWQYALKSLHELHGFHILLKQCHHIPDSVGSSQFFDTTVNNWVVVSNIFYFQPYLGKIPSVTNIFRRGWNHKLDKDQKTNTWGGKLVANLGLQLAKWWSN